MPSSASPRLPATKVSGWRNAGEVLSLTHRRTRAAERAAGLTGDHSRDQACASQTLCRKRLRLAAELSTLRRQAPGVLNSVTFNRLAAPIDLPHSGARASGVSLTSCRQTLSSSSPVPARSPTSMSTAQYSSVREESKVTTTCHPISMCRDL